MFNFSITKNQDRKPNVLYVDADEKYHFIIAEIVSDFAHVTFAKSVDEAVNQLKKDVQWDLMFLCVDNIDHSKIMNVCPAENVKCPSTILVTSYLDAIHLYELVAIYGADDYITKPFSNKRIIEYIEKDVSKNNEINVYKARLMQDIHFLNEAISLLSDKFEIQFPTIGFEPLDVHIEKLLYVRKKLEVKSPFSKFNGPTFYLLMMKKTLLMFTSSLLKINHLTHSFQET